MKKAKKREQTTQKHILKNRIPFLPLKQFIYEHHNGLTIRGLMQAIESGHLDWYSPTKDIFIVLTKKTLSWKPFRKPLPHNIDIYKPS